MSWLGEDFPTRESLQALELQNIREQARRNQEERSRPVGYIQGEDGEVREMGRNNYTDIARDADRLRYEEAFENIFTELREINKKIESPIIVIRDESI